jgi:hypothetical protein
VLRGAGAELGVTYLKAKVEPFVRPLAEELGTPIVLPCDVREPGQLEAVFLHIREQWGRLDLLLQSIAYAPKEDLHAESSIVPRRDSRWPWCQRLFRRVRPAKRMLGDKADDSAELRDDLDECGTKPVIPNRSNRTPTVLLQQAPLQASLAHRSCIQQAKGLPPYRNAL